LLLVQSKALDEAPYKLSEAIAKLAGITFWRLAFSYWFDKPQFLTEGKLATMLIIPSSWGSQLGGYLPATSSAAQVTWPQGWKRVLLNTDLVRSRSGTRKIWRGLFSCWRSWGGSHWSCGGCSHIEEMEAALSLPSIPVVLRVPWILVLEK
jgi:hypothetical protein